MKPATPLLGLAMLLVAALCVRLGVWQVSRYREKHRVNLETRAAMAAPPVDGTAGLPPLAAVVGRRLRLLGRYDERRQVLLSGRSHQGSPGVEVVTPFIPEAGGPAVLVNRGWLYAADAATALPQQEPAPGVREVTGLAQALRPVGRWGGLHPLLRDSVELWSSRALDRDSLARVLPYALAPYALRALPAAGAPPRPLATAPEPLNEMMHVSYAVQWFLFAAIALIGPAAFAWSRRRAAHGADRANPDLSFRDRA